MKTIMTIITLFIFTNIYWECTTHVKKCSDLREHIRKNKTLDPDGFGLLINEKL